MADEQWETLDIADDENPQELLEPAPQLVAPQGNVAGVPPPQLASPDAPPTASVQRQIRVLPPPPPPGLTQEQESSQESAPAPVPVRVPGQIQIPRRPPGAPPAPLPLNRTRRVAATGAAPRRTRRSAKYAKEEQMPIATDAQEWVQFRTEVPLRYSVATDGSYLARPLDSGGNPTSKNTIQPEPFYRASKEQIQTAYANATNNPTVLEADQLYKEARQTLMEHYREYQNIAGDSRVNPQEKLALRHQIVQDNKNVALTEKARNRAYGRNCRIDTYGGTVQPLLFQMLPDEAVDKEKVYSNDVYICRRANFPWSYFYTDSLPEVQVVAVPQAQALQAPAPQQGGAPNEFTSLQKEIIARKKISQWRTSRRAARF